MLVLAPVGRGGRGGEGRGFGFFSGPGEGHDGFNTGVLFNGFGQGDGLGADDLLQ